jgi:hypothetical protein
MGFTRSTFNSSNVEISRVFPALTVVGGGEPPFFGRQFIVPLELNRANPRRLVVAAFQAVYESFDQGDTITELATGSQAEASEANTMAYGHPANPDVLYVGAGGRLFVRLSAGAPLALSATPSPVTPIDVVIDAADFHKLYMASVLNVFVTPNAGSSYTDITGNLESFDPGFLRTIEFIPGPVQNLVVVGADRGVFAAATTALGTWQRVGSNLPLAPVGDMQYSAQSNLLVAGLVGRGAWTVTGLGRP